VDSLVKIKVFANPKSLSQQRRQRRQAFDRLLYLVEYVLTDALRREYRRQVRALAPAAPYPPHHLEYHVPHQGCLFCEIEIAEGILMEVK
jgi:hypothetical protein